MRHAIVVLFSAHTRARLRRLSGAFATPRRASLSALVILLSVVWTGQTVASMLLRDPYPIEDFRRCVGLALVAWSLWHIIRVTWKRPESPVEWAPAERDFILSAPFSTGELLAYRFVVILSATLPKALLTIMVLWPDLKWSTPVGLVLALVGLELFRMFADAGTCCLSTRGYNVFRGVVLAVLAALVLVCWPAADQVHGQDGTENLSAASVVQAVDSILARPVPEVLATPFFRAADVVTGLGSVATVATNICGMLLTLILLVGGIARLEAVWRRVSLEREPAQTENVPTNDDSTEAESGCLKRLPQIPLAGPLAWRQFRRATQYMGSLVISMLIPAVLLSPVVFTVQNASVAFGIVFGGAMFYTFVLLPEALKFDFRLDMDHLVQLKLLPMTATRVVVGQLTTPIFLACSFQFCVLTGVAFYRGVAPSILIVALCFCVPLNILFVALDNLVFLLYPHRPTQEGFEAFLRTIMKFTGKTLLITLSLASLVLWAPLAAGLAQLLSVGTPVVFLCGTIAGVAMIAAAAVWCVVVAFRRFDVSLHAM